MGFIAGCLLIALLGKVVWDFITKPGERTKMLQGYVNRPLASTYMVLWLAFFIMFFAGIFIRPFGEMNVTNDGWQVWEVGIFGFIGLWVVSWFVKIEDLDRK